MKKTNGFLKRCNAPFKEKANKLHKRAICFSIFIAILMAIIGIIIVLK